MDFLQPASTKRDQPSWTPWAVCLIPIIFGLFSVKLGQDYNWDLRNYHLYNAFSFLNGKLAVDLAPAQMQTYFNPVIDLLYYALIKMFPGTLVSFVMGVIHGANFVLAFIIARELIPARKNAYLPFLLALAGMFGNSFISQIGNTTGDNLTALTVLGSLAIVLRCVPKLAHRTGWIALLGAGVVMGLGVGLKLTVAVFALALCASLLALRWGILARIRAAFLFGIGVVTGMAISGGYWYWKMWSLFGNPLFPQFNNIFHSPLASPIAVADTRFLPHGIAEYLLWPVVFSLNPIRVSEIEVADPIWFLLFAGSAAMVVKWVLQRGAVQNNSHHIGVPDDRMRLAAAFFAFSFVVWMVLFSIYRYLVPLELLAPVILWRLGQALLPRVVAGKAVGLLLLLVIASNFPRANWGYAEPASVSFRADVPDFPAPSQSIVFTVDYAAPLGWLITLFPKELPAVGLGSNFPESDVYKQRVATMVKSRTGPMYAIFQTSVPKAGNARISPRDEELLLNAINVTSRYHLKLDVGSCAIHSGYIGNRPNYYKLCRVVEASS